jgi:general L-amino acid transport system permease protein
MAERGVSTGAATRVAPPRTSIWNDPAIRSVLYQVMVLGAVVALVAYLVKNTIDNLERQKIASGFGFLSREAGFAISESLIAYSPASSYAEAILTGLLNTLWISAFGIVLATILGTVIGIARLSKNWLIAKICAVYVEMVRNVPLLLQLFLWYAIITVSLPGPRQAYNPLPGFFLSNRGLKFPIPIGDPAYWVALVCLVAGVIGAVVVHRWAKARQARTGQPFPSIWTGVGLIVGLPILGWLIGGAPTALDVPALKGFNFAGGGNVSPEFMALLTGIVIYTAGFIAEIVRSGILAVPHGQTEAALAVGLRPGQVTRLVTLPQALRVIVPPMTSQYLNICKDSSLAVAVGYPDLVSVANTSINQTGQAIEGIGIIMMVYLSISLSISAFMNWYNKRIALKER